MGDSTASATEETTERSDKPSIDILRETKPAADISIKDSKKEEPTPEVQDTQADSAKPKGPAKIETVFEKLDMSSDKSDSTTDSAVLEPSTADKGAKAKPTVEIPPLEFEIRDNSSILKSDKHASDIFSLKELDSSKQKNANSIWSINGAPSGRLNRKKDNASSIFPAGCMGCKEEPPCDPQVSPRRFIDAKEASEHHAGHIDSTPRKRPASSKPRNPITGGGIEDEDVRRANTRKKDGNPLLGVGYDEAPAITSSTTRIPPGGHSKGLW